MTTAEKVAYLKGLAEGLGTDKDTNEGKLITAIIDTLETMSADLTDLGGAFDELGDSFDDLCDDVDDISDALEQVSDDLDDVEDILYGDDEYERWEPDEDEDEDDEDEDEDDEECQCCCGSCGDGPYFYSVTCPACDNTITIDEDVLALGGIECPNCGGKLEFLGVEDEPEETDEEPVVVEEPKPAKKKPGRKPKAKSEETVIEAPAAEEPTPAEDKPAKKKPGRKPKAKSEEK